MINYNTLVQKSFCDIVRSSLLALLENNISNKSCFYITFNSNYDGVDIPNYLKLRYTEDITIVLQHQFWDLNILDDFFSVTLSFNNVVCNISIPFKAILAFMDPYVMFGLQCKSFDIINTNSDSSIRSKINFIHDKESET